MANYYSAAATSTATCTVSTPTSTLRCTTLYLHFGDRGDEWSTSAYACFLTSTLGSELSTNITSMLSSALTSYNTDKIFSIVGATAGLLTESNDTTESMRADLLSYISSASSYQVSGLGLALEGVVAARSAN